MSGSSESRQRQISFFELLNQDLSTVAHFTKVALLSTKRKILSSISSTSNATDFIGIEDVV